MTIHNLAQNVVLVELHREPHLSDDVKTATDIARDRGDCDLIPATVNTLWLCHCQAVTGVHHRQGCDTRRVYHGVLHVSIKTSHPVSAVHTC